jgi:Holliday junction resolvase-like predicted endonuclease
MSTTDIYRHAFAILRQSARHAANRYSLRRSLLSLGPTGFPFERFIAELFKRKGYETLVDQVVKGRCVEHEIDIVAWNSEKLIMVEAKFHNEAQYKSDLKVALYVKARIDDLADASFSYGGRERALNEGWLVTNTKFTDKAISYGECAGVRLLGWNYPRTANLHELIQETGMVPITCLTTISEREKQTLLEAGVILCSDLREGKERLRSLGLPEETISEVTLESEPLCPT